MNQKDAYSEYKKNEVLTASQSKLIIMLYDGAIKNLKLAEIGIRENKIEKTNEHLKKAQDIITEFMSTLNFDNGGEVAEGLHLMYEYMLQKLVHANIHKKIEDVEEVRRYLEELRSAWAQG